MSQLELARERKGARVRGKLEEIDFLPPHLLQSLALAAGTARSYRRSKK